MPDTRTATTSGTAATTEHVCFDCDCRIYRPVSGTGWIRLDGRKTCPETGKAHRTPEAARRAIRKASTDHAQEG